MKNKFIFLMALLSFLIFLGTSQVYADLLVEDNPYDYYNPAQVLPDNDTNITAWLSGLTGETVYPFHREESYFVGTDIKINPYYVYDPYEIDPELDDGYDWVYAVIKYGTLSIAFEDTNNNNILDELDENDFLDFIGLDGFELVDDPFIGDGGSMWQSKNGISNITLFGTTPVPEPATMLLFGSGLIGLAAVGRKRFRK